MTGPRPAPGDSEADRFSLERFSLGGQRVMITGASGGLGAEMALACAAAGATVTVVARGRDRLEAIAAAIRAAGGTVHVRPSDLSDAEQVAELAAELAGDRGGGARGDRPVDGIVHAAGIQVRADAVDFEADDLRRVLAVNLEAPFLLSQGLARAQIAQRRTGSHVFVGSIGATVAIPRAVAYTAGKAGLLGLVHTLATEWARHGVRVNALSPGYALTELTSDLLTRPEQRARVLSRIPMGRLGRGDDLAGPVVFLLSPAAGYVTGQQLVVDGGWLAS